MKKLYIPTHTIRSTGKNGKPLTITKGQPLTPSQLKNILPRHDQYIEIIELPPTPRTKMTKDELYLLGDLYNSLSDPKNQSDNREEIISQFSQIYPNRPVNSLVFYICQCKNLDTYYASTGFTSVNHNLITILHGLDADRYMSEDDYSYCKSFI